MDHLSAPLANLDPEIAHAISNERTRQEAELNLIASENYTPPAVCQAVGSILTNKYAEGYPGKRYYGGCTNVDTVEQLAIDRCKELFGTEHVNVQPHAGSQANMAAYFALLKPGDGIMGMSLAAGGHLTHGHPVNFSGTLFKAVQYGVNPETELLDYDEIARIAHEHKPRLIVVGASSYSRTFDFARMSAIAQDVGAYLMADIAHIAGLVATGVHPSPVGHADVITSTTHKTLRGPRGGMIMSKQAHAEKIDRAIIPGTQGGPLMHVIAGKAVAFGLALKPEFAAYQKNIVQNAQALAHALHSLGYRIVSGGTDNHMFVLDLRAQKITGLAAERALAAAGISVSRSCIPFDPEKPWITSGIRLGTPAITTRGMGVGEMGQIATLIHDVLTHHDDAAYLAHVKKEVAELCTTFGIYEQQAIPSFAGHTFHPLP